MKGVNTTICGLKGEFLPPIFQQELKLWGFGKEKVIWKTFIAFLKILKFFMLWRAQYLTELHTVFAFISSGSCYHYKLRLSQKVRISFFTFGFNSGLQKP